MNLPPTSTTETPDEVIVFGQAFSRQTVQPAIGGAGESTDIGTAIKSHLNQSVTEVQSVIDQDLSGRRNYQLQPTVVMGSAMPGQVMQGTASVFGDSGLPRIRALGSFIESITPSFASSEVIPNFDISSQSVGHVWPANTRPRRNQIRNSMGNLFRFLTRMEWRNTEAWQGPRSERWVRQYRSPMAYYLNELFSGRFVDRNGNKIGFSLGVDLTSLTELSNLKLSPELAGKVISTFIEFLGDMVFQVPYYSPSLLKVYGDKRTNDAALAGSAEQLDQVQQSIVDGTLDSDTAEKLGIPVHGDLDWSVLFTPDASDPMIPVSDNKVSTVIGSQTCRMLAAKVGQLDQQLVDLTATSVGLDREIASINGNSSKTQNAFTIHSAGIQQNALRCIFLPEDGLTCHPSNIGSSKDYANLVGKLVALAAQSAEANTRAVIGGVVRGISLFALDNEVVAEVIASSAATAAKKAAEAFTYRFVTRFINDTSVDVNQRRAVLERWRSIHERLTES